MRHHGSTLTLALLLSAVGTLPGCASSISDMLTPPIDTTGARLFVIEEFSSGTGAGYWFRNVSTSELHRSVDADGEATWSMRPTAFSITGRGANEYVTEMEEGVNPVQARSDEARDRVGFDSPLAARANVVLARVDPRGRLKPGVWRSPLPALDVQSGLGAEPAVTEARVVASEERVAGRPFYLAAFGGEYGTISDLRTDASFDLGFDGYMLLDPATEEVFGQVFRYFGTVRTAAGEQVPFVGQQTLWLGDAATGEPLLGPDDVAGLRSLARDFPALTPVEGELDAAVDPRAPPWFTPVWAAARQTQVAAAAAAEGRSNPAVVITIIAVHAVEGLAVFGGNVAYDLYQSVRDGSFQMNPFDGDVPSPLGMVYEAGAGVVVSTAAWAGVVDQENVGYYTTVGGAAAKIPGDVASIFVNPGNVRGAATSIGGILRSPATVGTKATALGGKAVSAVNGAIRGMYANPTGAGIVMFVGGVGSATNDAMRANREIQERRAQRNAEFERDLFTNPDPFQGGGPQTPRPVDRVGGGPGGGPGQRPGDATTYGARQEPFGSFDTMTVEAGTGGFHIRRDGRDLTGEIMRDNPSYYDTVQRSTEAFRRSEESQNYRSVIRRQGNMFQVDTYANGEHVGTMLVPVPPGAMADMQGPGPGSGVGAGSHQRFHELMRYTASQGMKSANLTRSRGGTGTSVDVKQVFGEVHNPYGGSGSGGDPYQGSSNPYER